MSATPLDIAMDTRRIELRLRWQHVADRAGISLSHLKRIRNGKSPINDFVARGVEDALQWEPGSVAAIEAGDAPMPRRQVVQVGQATETTIAQPVRPVRWQDGDDMPEGLDDAEKDLWETAGDRMEFELLRRAHRRAVEIRAEMAAEDRQDRRERHEGHHEREDRDDRARRHG